MPNYNGRSFLERYLPSLVRAATARPGTELTVVDDASTDDSVGFLRKEMPAVTVLERPLNGGFGEACNTGARAAEGDVLVFVMTDLRVEVGFLEPLVRPLEDPTVFAVSPRIITDREKGDDVGVARLFFSRGMCHLDWPGARPGGKGGVQEIDFATGGAMACGRRRFLALGGFDAVYAPYYWEDVDLSYRARRRGWRILSEPGSVVYHLEPHAVTGSLPDAGRVARTTERNRYLFTWANVMDRRLLTQHLLWLVPRLAKRLLSGDLGALRAWGAALRRLPAVLTRRRAERRAMVVKDRALLHLEGDA